MSLLLATSGDIANGGVVEPEGIDFDGVNDYLSRSTDLVGNVDSKTFTFSAWVYTTQTDIAIINNTNNRFIGSISGGQLRLVCHNTSDATILNIQGGQIPKNTWVNILVSVDLSNVLKRHLYINDINISGAFGTYTNNSIDMTGIGTYYIPSPAYKGRLSNLFLSYDYIDLSIEANRRIFISSDGKPT